MFDTHCYVPVDTDELGVDGYDGGLDALDIEACDAVVDDLGRRAARVAQQDLEAVEAEQRAWLAERSAVQAAVVAGLEAVEVMQDLDAIADLDACHVLAKAAAGQRKINLAQAEQLAAAAHWADLNATLQTATPVRGGERLIRAGGDGTPKVAEFAPVELAAMLGW